MDVMLSGFSPFDQVTEGLVKGTCSILYGAPGTGKTTLMLQVLGGLALGGYSSLVISREQTSGDLKKLANRIGLTVGRGGILLNLFGDEHLHTESALEIAEIGGPSVLVIDSLFSLCRENKNKARKDVFKFKEFAEYHNSSVVFTWPVTGNSYAPTELAHIVDSEFVLIDVVGETRELRLHKNRYTAGGREDKVSKLMKLKASGFVPA